MNSLRAASLIIGIILLTSFADGSESIPGIKADDQDIAGCEQERDISREHLESTIENAKALYEYCGCYDD